MKIRLKKLIAVLLAVVMLVPIGALAGYAATCSCPNTPYVYVYGQQWLWVTEEDGTRHAPLEEDSYDIPAIAKALAPVLFKAIQTDDWTEYGEALYNVMAPTYAELKVDGNGFPINANTGIEHKWDYASVSGAHYRHMGEPHIYRFDSRLSPMDVADDMHAYIEAVKEKTGHDKVNIVSRCLGCSYVMAYLYKYERENNYSGVNRLILLNGTQNGTTWLNAVFTGNIEIDADSLVRFLHTSESLTGELDSNISELLFLTVDMLSETYSINRVIDIIQRMYDKIKDTAIAPIIREYYGTCGGYLAMLTDGFDEAIDYIFPTEADKAAYAGVIAKAKDYNDNVLLKNDEILLEMDAASVPVFTIVEYGYQQYPVAGEQSALVADNTIGVVEQSFGATVSKVDSTLSQEYIDAQTAAGLGKYISADKQIDASTCLFPERTWFIKNLNHQFPNEIHVMVNYLAFTADAPTIDSNPAYPQFMNCTKRADGYEYFVPLQETNAEDVDWAAIEDTKGAATAEFFKRILNFFKNFIQYIIEAIKSIVDQATE